MRATLPATVASTPFSRACAERAIGSVSVCSHLTVADGIEVVIDPQRAGLSPEAVRQFIQGVMNAFKAAQGEEDGASQADPANTNKNERQARES